MFPEPIIFAPIHRCFSVSRYGNRSHEMSTGTRDICSQTPLENKSRVTNWQETSLSFCSDTSFGIEFSSMIRRSNIAMVIEFNTSGTISTICASDAEPSSNGIKKALPTVATCLGIRLRPNASHQRAGAIDADFKTDPTAGSVACDCYPISVSGSMSRSSVAHSILRCVSTSFHVEKTHA